MPTDEKIAVDTPEEEKEVYLAWRSPSRLFKRRDKEYFTNIGAIVFLLSVILIFAREYVLVAVVLAIVFLIYVLSTVPPEDVDHRITNLGIDSAGTYYRWETLGDFWFEEQWSQQILVLRPLVGARAIVLIRKEDKDRVRELLAKHIPFREKPQKTWVDNAANWISEKIPLEKQA